MLTPSRMVEMSKIVRKDEAKVVHYFQKSLLTVKITNLLIFY
jgi:hypothetical protein